MAFIVIDEVELSKFDFKDKVPLSDSQIRKMIKHSKNPMEIKMLNKLLSDRDIRKKKLMFEMRKKGK